MILVLWVLTSGLIGTTEQLRFLRESGFDEDFRKEVEEVGELGFGADYNCCDRNAV